MLHSNKCTDYSLRSLLFMMEIILGIILLYYEWFKNNDFNTYISTGWFSLIAIYQLVFIGLTLKSLGNIQFDFTIGTKILVAEIIWCVIGIFYSAMYLSTKKNTMYLFILIISLVNIFYYVVVWFFYYYLCSVSVSVHEETELEESLLETIENQIDNSLDHEHLIENNLSQYEVIPIAEEYSEDKDNDNYNINEELCSICLESHTSGIITTMCNHQYHFKCLIQWLQIEATCPECRSPVRANI